LLGISPSVALLGFHPLLGLLKLPTWASALQ
jgi:hypothetical protein